jgi:hypothetical protein
VADHNFSYRLGALIGGCLRDRFGKRLEPLVVLGGQSLRARLEQGDAEHRLRMTEPEVECDGSAVATPDEDRRLGIELP